jgi:hypothetical protein
MVDDGRLAALETEYASAADRAAVLEARWQQLADEYVSWRDRESAETELSIVEDREFPDAYGVLRAQYEVDVELFELRRSMHEMQDEIVVLRTASAPAPAEIQVWPAPVEAPPRRSVSSWLVAAVAIVAIAGATFLLTRGSGEKPTVEIDVPAQMTPPISWRVSEPKVIKRVGACRKTARLTVGKGAEHAGQPVAVRIEGKDFPVADDRAYKLGRSGAVNVAYETKTCAGSPVNSLHVLTVDNDTNVAPQRSR